MVIGSTIIHEDVLREIVRLLLEEMEEVYCFEPKGPLAPFRGDKSIKPSIVVRRLENSEEGREAVAFEIKVAIMYGAPIPQTVAKIRQEVAERIEKYTGYETDSVDVYITRLIRFEKERSEQTDEPETQNNN
ncbi:MAG TPA: hypothetical protein DIT32_00800 [Peptococcaceae bacterium]|nr:hypothetical protein [Peptococcaceae bacterium]